MKDIKRSDQAALVEAARRSAGDAAEDAVPLTKEERAIMEEARRATKRPSKAEIRAEAKRLLT